MQNINIPVSSQFALLEKRSFQNLPKQQKGQDAVPKGRDPFGIDQGSSNASATAVKTSPS